MCYNILYISQISYKEEEEIGAVQFSMTVYHSQVICLTCAERLPDLLPMELIAYVGSVGSGGRGPDDRDVCLGDGITSGWGQTKWQGGICCDKGGVTLCAASTCASFNGHCKWEKD